MADGVWRMTDEGEFEINEPYKTMLQEVRVFASQAWTGAVVSYLAAHSDYGEQELASELVRRNSERDGEKVPIFEEFVLEALSGDLFT